MEKFNRCWACMEPLEEGQKICPKCQYQNELYYANPRCLKPGTLLNNRFYVGIVLGEGGFGVTYIGWDTILDMTVAIKEYFPANVASRDCTASLTNDINIFGGRSEQEYKLGLERYIREARTLSKFHDLHGIVDIRDFFHENNTAYLVMEYLKGPTLEEHIKQYGRMKPEYVFQIMKPVMRSLEKIHQAGMVHRDISPDNIMLSDGCIKLIDFGAARLANNDNNKSLTVVLKRGFAPEEQYRSNGKQGPWTDVYAICATIYYMLTGKKPPESIERTYEDTLQSFDELEIPVDKEKSDALMKGLAPIYQNRYQSIRDLCNDLYSDSEIPPSQQFRKDQELLEIVEQEELEEESKKEVQKAIEDSIRIREEKKNEKEIPELMEYDQSESIAIWKNTKEPDNFASAKEEQVKPPVDIKPEEPPKPEADVKPEKLPKPEADVEPVQLPKPEADVKPEEPPKSEADSKPAESSKHVAVSKDIDSLKPVNPKKETDSRKSGYSGAKENDRSPRKIVITIAAILGVVIIVVAGRMIYKGMSPSKPVQNETKKESSVDPSTSADALSETDNTVQTTEPVEEITMVDVKKKTLQAAKAAINSLEDQELQVTASQEYSDKIKKGCVIRQSISAGEKFEKGTKSEIKLVISKGSKPVVVPSVLNIDKEKAIKKLHRKGLKYKILSYQYSSSYKKGAVMQQKIAAGKTVKKGKMVGLVISDGAKPVAQTSTSAQSQTRTQTKSPTSSTSRSTGSSKKKKDYSNPIVNGGRANPIE
ncbi:PASTA domain-containing protein [Jutongia sp.]|uniref:protein kinase domain-containing protein n=1 Tax=Jutongia sp. TaxID=2944204 RepID=UPI003080BD99